MQQIRVFHKETFTEPSSKQEVLLQVCLQDLYSASVVVVLTQCMRDLLKDFHVTDKCTSTPKHPRQTELIAVLHPNYMCIPVNLWLCDSSSSWTCQTLQIYSSLSRAQKKKHNLFQIIKRNCIYNSFVPHKVSQKYFPPYFLCLFFLFNSNYLPVL